ncbi:COX15/CtaA family protein [Fulvivirga lutea]|uniref:COX15/CtaA family protein n=1 Tax=Fulvivirga lutea TaxID=2810512 RepID=A0A974WEV0_9BACT|nr:COX15/CtaA family protein [Fulvivirga lutea]QSE97108.1 COX15/CtaA family protein [Fulvivirga lutea]
MKNNNQDKSRLGKFSLLTLVAIYFLILVGGIVRSTGSGMGCPDWPKCFGSWVPPTELSDLPPNYKEVYSQKRAAKNIKLAKYLNAIGFDATASRIVNDESILEEADFNPTKTWIEYLNRLVGVAIGLLVIGTFLFSIPFRKTEPSVFYLSLGSLILVIFQGWVGSLVVSTNLIPFMVSIHMIIAIVIVFLLSVIVIKTNPQLKFASKRSKYLKNILILCMLVMFIQIVLGTQVRESIDQIAASLSSRHLWIENLGIEFIIHRSFSWVVLLINVYLIYTLYKLNILNQTAKALLAVVLITIITGVIMAYFNIPAMVQPIHLLLGTMGIGLQFFLFLQLKKQEPVTA